MSIIKKFSNFINGKTLDQYLSENNDKYLQMIEEMKPGEGQIYITNQNRSDKLYKFLKPSGINLKDWRYFNDYPQEIYLIKKTSTYLDTDYFSNILQIKEVDQFKDTSISITKPVDLKLTEIKEALQKETGYIWQTIDELMFHTFNNDPGWGFNTSHYDSEGIIVLEIFNYNIKTQIDNNPADKKELGSHIEWIKDQLGVISGHPFKPYIEYKKNNNTRQLNGVNIKFILDYPRL